MAARPLTSARDVRDVQLAQQSIITARAYHQQQALAWVKLDRAIGKWYFRHYCALGAISHRLSARTLAYYFARNAARMAEYDYYGMEITELVN